MDPYSTSILPSSPTTLAPPPPRNVDRPSYSNMICSAIRALKEKNGSSKRSIGKYMKQEYKDLLPPNHETLLTQNLNDLKEKNILIMVKRSYKFPVPSPHQNAEPKSTQLGLNDEGEFSSSVVGATTEVKKMGQDRSLKVSGEEEEVSSMLRLENGKRVRRPSTKYQSFPTEIISNDHKRKPGRPQKAHVKPARSNGGGALGSSKPRGRPKKNVVASPSIAGSSAAYGGGKKPVVARKPKKKTIEKPVGCTEGSEVDKHKDIKADLRNKFKFIKTRLSRAVTVLRTYFHRRSPVVTRIAIHDLQDLASLDMDMLLTRGDTPPPTFRKPGERRPVSIMSAPVRFRR
ncbi:putative High mobility group protein HMGA [Lupinus albus]|uniref:Putative High mobility group protein HMGA n=1 Tax=Lupinus albus TaxID=3870 RepID=A0A6A4Q1U3_LUPAL|nr:putative High mobility group protein HMGA [Lupinus albus]